MLSRLLLPLLLLAGAAQAQDKSALNTYLVQPDLKTAMERSRQQCVAMKCDGVNTVYWWNVIELKDGTAAVEIQPDGSPYAKETTVDQVTDGLKAEEVAAVVDAATVAPLLPEPAK